MSNVPPCIAVIQKWNKDKHGISSDEEKYTNYLSTKYLFCRHTHYYDSDTDYSDTDDSDTDDEYFEYDEYSSEIQLNASLSFANIRAVNIQDWFIVYRNEIPCVIKKTYVYKDRTFCIRNYGIEIFQKLWRDFHYIKMARYKAIKNLQYRQIYGKFS